MNVLWITNIVFPEALELISGKGTLKSSGGWLIGAAAKLCQEPSIHLTIATVSKQVKQLTWLAGVNVTYCLLPIGKGNKRVNHDYEPMWKQVQQKVKPDVVHLHGTEFSHGLAYLEACGAENVCVSIQGLTSACCYYYHYGLTRLEIYKALTPRSLMQGGILRGRREYKHRAVYEIEILKRVNHIIGRTSWDKACTWTINPTAHYHYGGETLRSVFYTGDTWKYDKCSPHTIFLSQAFYPIKGLHMVLRSMPQVLKHYPDAKLRVAGPDISRSTGWKELVKLTNYGMVIRKMISKLHLHNCVTFTGALDAEGMRKEYLNCNIFVSPSSIENSPNSLGEAQLLGVPVIASYVGGVIDMMKGDENHLYRFEDVEVLAYKICELFSKKDNIDTDPIRKAALERHNPEKNLIELLHTYEEIVG